MANLTAPAKDETVQGDILTPEQLALRLQVKRSTIYSHLGRWDERHGVMRLSSKCTRIHWPTFFNAMMAGKITLRGKS